MTPTHSDSPTVAKYLKEYQRKRDFNKTKEPSGDAPLKLQRGQLQFVIQKHAASHLHFDLRLELDGVMRSWAVPKGPSVDPSVKRLAMEVEDHPMGYNTFEGTIPKGEYGGGTVMLWDRGTYTVDEKNADEGDEDAARRGLKAGKLAFSFHGTRLQGSFALVRTRRGEERAQWLLIKHHDDFSSEDRDIVSEVSTSVATNRTMESIASGDNTALHELESSGSIEAMESSKAKLPLPSGDWAVEPRIHGTRAIALIANGTATLLPISEKSRAKDGSLNDAAPSVAEELIRLSRGNHPTLAIDGILTDDRETFVAIDLLLEGANSLVTEPLLERRVRLEDVLSGVRSDRHKRICVINWSISSAEEVESAAYDLDTTRVVVKRIDSAYESGVSKYWLEISL